MINISAFEVARQKCQTHDMPFLAEMLMQVKNDKRYKGLKILHNSPLTIEAVIKIETLVVGGADVTARCLTLIPPREEALEILKAANVRLQLEHVFDGEYDFHLDCCGELIDARPPKIGAVELTQTGGELYRRVRPSYPMISTDDSVVKVLETFFGTGDGFTRALYEITGKEMYDKPYVIFGFGKVGQGILHSLKKITRDITVIDINQHVMNEMAYPNVKFINGTKKESIKQNIKKPYCIVTATGIKNVISQYYNLDKEDLGESILANMGAEDEYGENFLQTDVLFDKKPLNFSISEPTTMKYLDPVFYAHNLGIDIIQSEKIQHGYNSFPNDISLAIIKKWQEIHKERLEIVSREGTKLSW